MSDDDRPRDLPGMEPSTRDAEFDLDPTGRRPMFAGEPEPARQAPLLA